MNCERIAHPTGLLTDAPMLPSFQCFACKEQLAGSMFGIKRGKRRSSCKGCVNQQIRVSEAKARAADPVAYLKRRGEYSKEWRARNPELIASLSRRYSVKRKFGLSLEEVASLLQSQGNCCAICRCQSPGTRAWSIDHDHLTGAVRGVLCSLCNTGLGQYRDDPQRLLNAAAYLERAAGTTP